MPDHYLFYQKVPGNQVSTRLDLKDVVYQSEESGKRVDGRKEEDVAELQPHLHEVVVCRLVGVPLQAVVGHHSLEVGRAQDGQAVDAPMIALRSNF